MHPSSHSSLVLSLLGFFIQNGHSYAANTYQVILFIDDPDLPNLCLPADVERFSCSLNNAGSDAAKMVGIYLQSDATVGLLVDAKLRRYASERLSERHGRSAVQQSERLLSSRLNRHGRFQEIIADLSKADTQVFYHRPLGEVVQSLRSYTVFEHPHERIRILPLNGTVNKFSIFAPAFEARAFCTRTADGSAKIHRKLSIKKIYLVRHGQTDFNLKNIVQGSGVDTDLNEKGRAQAEAFFQMYKDVPFEKVYTSALKRSKQSVQRFLDLGIPHESLAGLNEISWGTKEGQKVTPTEDEYYHFMIKQWQLGNTSLKIEKGESPDDVVKRMKPAVDHIMAQENEQTILICMHGRAIRILLCYLLNYPLRSMDLFEHENLCLYVLRHTGSMFQVELHNDIAHLRSFS